MSTRATSSANPLTDNFLTDKLSINKPLINKPLINKPLINNSLIDNSLIDKLSIDKPLINKPLIDNSLIDKPLIDKPLIEFQKVTKIYGQGQAAMAALAGIDLRIYQGDFVAVMGPSGSGKSTCMNILGCLDVPTSGSYLFKDLEVGSLSRDQRAILRRMYLGFVFQGFNLLNRTSALENVELPLIYRNIPARQRHGRARQALESVGLGGWESHTPGELSGGQQQRVAIARAMVIEPAVLLADEPTGNLDTARSHEIMELLTALNRERGLTIIMVTHEHDIAAYAKRTIRFLDGLIEVEEQNGGRK